MRFFRPLLLPLFALGVAIISLLMAIAVARADPRTQCPTPAPCKVIVLNAEEEKVLTGQNMVLDTAVQGRQIDLFGVVSYLRNKIASAPAGDAPAAATAAPADSSVVK